MNSAMRVYFALLVGGATGREISKEEGNDRLAPSFTLWLRVCALKKLSDGVFKMS